jgi:hypothetical protein
MNMLTFKRQIKGMEQYTPEQCESAVMVLHLAITHLGGESPEDVYTSDGYNVWLRAVVRSVADALTESAEIKTKR